MRAKAMIGITAVLFALLCAGCGTKTAQTDPAAQENTQTAQAQLEYAAQTAQSGDLPQSAEAATTGSAGSDAAPRGSTSAAQTSAASKAGESAASSVAAKGSTGGTTAKSGGKSDVPQLDPPARVPDPSKPQNTDGTTTSKQTGSTTAQTTVSSTAASGSSGSVTPVTPGGSSGSPAQTAASDTTVSTAASTTKRSYEEAKGDLVKATVTYLNDKPNYISTMDETTLERFGIVGSKQKEVMRNPSDWAAYTIELEFVNNETMPVTLYYLDVTDNGKKDVFINGDMSAELGVNPGRKTSERFFVLAKKSDSDGAVLNKIHSMAMRVQYAATPAEDDAQPKFVYADVG